MPQKLQDELQNDFVGLAHGVKARIEAQKTPNEVGAVSALQILLNQHKVNLLKSFKAGREGVIDDVLHIEPLDTGDNEETYIIAVDAVNVYRQFLLKQLRSK